MNDVFVFLILLLGFVAGASKNLQRSRQRLQRAKIPFFRKMEAGAAVVLLTMVAILGGNHGVHYMLALMAGTFVVSGAISAGIHPEGILYFHGTSVLLRIERWEEIEEASLKETEEKFFLYFKGKRGTCCQEYSKEVAGDIRQLIKKKAPRLL
ncbi:hypothetical protein [Tindallia californiensis]|uniref:DUF5673 domain-containing protein n=1 Tax=Tindallia californiensis TaxID=159292 RepID=A0A1H3Q2T3_9FIRM|nr:hypothetical protein [Tindallia californiensis]SDZ07696.1 hypothetical protein SAMN05192546_10844 [Tindallia californiensis]